MRHGTASPASLVFLTAAEDARLCCAQNVKGRLDVNVHDGVHLRR